MRYPTRDRTMNRADLVGRHTSRGASPLPSASRRSGRGRAPTASHCVLLAFAGQGLRATPLHENAPLVDGPTRQGPQEVC